MATILTSPKGIVVRPHVQKFADALEREFGVRAFGTYNGHSPPEGPTQAIDIHTPDNATGWALQDRICQYARNNAHKYGIRYVIRREFIWNIERAAEGWRWQGHQGSRTADHYDHVHVTFYEDAPINAQQPEEDELAAEDIEWIKSTLADVQGKVIGLEVRFEELKREASQAVGQSNWHMTGEAANTIISSLFNMLADIKNAVTPGSSQSDNQVDL